MRLSHQVFVMIEAREIKKIKKVQTISSTVLLSFFICPLLFLPIYSGGRRLCILKPSHRPPFCHTNHGKSLTASGLLAFGLEASELEGFQFVFPRLMVLGLVVTGSMVLLQLVCWCQVWWVVSLEATGFKALSLAVLSLAAVGLKPHHVHHPDAAKLTSVTKSAECDAAKPNVGKAVGLSGAVSGKGNNRPILRIS